MRGLRAVGTAVALLVLGGTAPAAAHADDVTPDGPATLTQAGGCARPAIGLAGAVLTGISVTVGPGSRADRVRVRTYRDVLTEWYDLPAAAGTYVIPAVPRPWLDPYDEVLGLDQQGGGVAVLRAESVAAFPGCSPIELRVRGGDPPPGPQAPVTQSVPDRRLALHAVTARDYDGDQVPDDQERTDMALALGATPVRGTTQVVARIVNRGPNAVSGVRLTLAAPTTAGLASPAGLPCSSPLGAAPGAIECAIRGPVGPGATIDVPFAVRTPQDPLSVTGTLAPVTSDPDLDPSNDSATAAVLPAAPTLTLLGPTRARIGDPIRLRLRSDRAGSFDLRGTVALPGGRTLTLPARTVALATDVRRVVTVRPTARQARSLRRRASRPLTATFTLAGDDATPPALAVRLRR